METTPAAVHPGAAVRGGVLQPRAVARVRVPAGTHAHGSAVARRTSHAAKTASPSPHASRHSMQLTKPGSHAAHRDWWGQNGCAFARPLADLTSYGQRPHARSVSSHRQQTPRSCHSRCAHGTRALRVIPYAVVMIDAGGHLSGRSSARRCARRQRCLVCTHRVATVADAAVGASLDLACLPRGPPRGRPTAVRDRVP